MATFIELAETTYPQKVDNLEDQPPEGKSLTPIFNGKKRDGHDSLYFHFGTDRALRQGKWKNLYRQKEAKRAL